MSTRLTAAFHQAGSHRFLQALLVLLLGINVGRPLALLQGAAGAELLLVAQSWLALVVVQNWLALVVAQSWLPLLVDAREAEQELARVVAALRTWQQQQQQKQQKQQW